VLGFNDGSPEAPVKVLELSDFGCGYCRRFHAETYPRIRQVYVEAGLVEWKYVPVSIGFPNGLQAAIAGECAGEQGRFPAMRARLFGEQAQWRGAGDPYPLFVDLARQEGLDVERFKACIGGRWREARVRDNLRLSGELGARGTPTFVVDGQILPGAQPLDAFRDILDAALRRRGLEPPRR
jgi:protein-disulfide isomerase